VNPVLRYPPHSQIVRPPKGSTKFVRMAGNRKSDFTTTRYQKGTSARLLSQGSTLINFVLDLMDISSKLGAPNMAAIQHRIRASQVPRVLYMQMDSTYPKASNQHPTHTHLSFPRSIKDTQTNRKAPYIYSFAFPTIPSPNITTRKLIRSSPNNNSPSNSCKHIKHR
jgi:hypothetical protein